MDFGIDAFGDRALRLRQAAMRAQTGLSPTAAFTGLARPVMAAGSVVRTLAFAVLRLVVLRTKELSSTFLRATVV